ncbi:MAG TPA: winged helix-turn-helix domain-containing protein [Candidatus Methylomirabilis sp.]|jgi:DNA-binding response OmpR family regulator|nr:winged helix-turn-helix domain-containing protein [Candidatus Methylomirabilis sp.]
MPDPARCGEFVGALQDRGLPAVQATTASQAIHWARREPPALVVIDLAVDRSRIVLQEFRREGRAVVALSPDSRIRTWALEAGCLDAPDPALDPHELALKAAVLVREGLRARGRVLAGPLMVDLSERCLLWRGRKLRTTPLLVDLAAYLAARAGEIVPVPTLLEQVWGEPWASAERVHHAVWRLRGLLGEGRHSAFLVGRRGHGYGVFPESPRLTRRLGAPG